MKFIIVLNSHLASLCHYDQGHFDSSSSFLSPSLKRVPVGMMIVSELERSATILLNESKGFRRNQNILAWMTLVRVCVVVCTWCCFFA